MKINRKVEDKEEGYQRALSVSRADRIAKFIDAKNVLPTSVLISFDEGEFKGGKLVVPRRKDAGWVIDGQHRLEGAHRAKTDITLPVVAFVGLADAEQVNCFVTINREHKGVPTSLYYELLKQLPGSKLEADATKEIAADIASIAKRDEDSPFYRRIVSTSAPKSGEISLTNWVRKIAPLIKVGGRLSTLPFDERLGVLDNYYKGLGQVFTKEFNRTDSVFFKTIGFGALMNVLPAVLDLCLQQYKGFRVADVAKLFKQVEHFDFNGWRQLGTGNAAETSAGNDLRAELSDAFSDTQKSGIVLK